MVIYMLKTLTAISERLSAEQKAAEERNARLNNYENAFHDAFSDLSAWLTENVNYKFTQSETCNVAREIIEDYFSNCVMDEYYTDAVQAAVNYQKFRTDSLHDEAEKVLKLIVDSLSTRSSWEAAYQFLGVTAMTLDESDGDTIIVIDDRPYGPSNCML